MPTAEIDGVEIYYERHGDQGEPLVLVHGFTGDITDWRHQIEEFSPTHRLLVLDNRGHGRSAAPADASAYSIERMADDVEAVIDRVGFDRYHLLGHSMGGTIAQEIAISAPTRLLSLTLEDTSYCFGGHRLGTPRQPPQLPPERMEEVFARLARMSQDVLRACWKALVGWQGIEHRAGAIRSPTLILYGEHDAEAIVEGSQRLAELIAGSEVRVIAEAGHSPQEERPQPFNSALRSFLERHRTRRSS